MGETSGFQSFKRKRMHLLLSDEVDEKAFNALKTIMKFPREKESVAMQLQKYASELDPAFDPYDDPSDRMLSA